MAKSDDFDDLADNYTLAANEDISLGGLEFSLAKNDLEAGRWSDALMAYSEGAEYYAKAAEANALSSAYRAIATTLRAIGQ